MLKRWSYSYHYGGSVNTFQRWCLDRYDKKRLKKYEDKYHG